MIYLTQRDILREGDEYHQFGRLWFPVSKKHIGKRKGDVFSHKTRVRRPPVERAAESQKVMW